MNREGKTYKHKVSGSVILVVKSRSMSAGTTRHTVLILDEGMSVGRRGGQQVEIDEVPVQPWTKGWEIV